VRNPQEVFIQIPPGPFCDCQIALGIWFEPRYQIPSDVHENLSRSQNSRTRVSSRASRANLR